LRAMYSGFIECRWVDLENVSGSVSARVNVDG
jgi:hypothetical protein